MADLRKALHVVEGRQLDIVRRRRCDGLVLADEGTTPCWRVAGLPADLRGSAVRDRKGVLGKPEADPDLRVDMPVIGGRSDGCRAAGRSRRRGRQADPDRSPG
jgi:hypothetical protein